MEVGDTIKRNFSPIFATNRNTDTRIKSICSGAVYKIIDRRTETAGYTYTIQNKPGDTYKIASIDLKDHFYKVDSENGETPQPMKKCTCCSISLRDFGCTCGCIANMLDRRYTQMQKEMLGPEKSNE